MAERIKIGDVLFNPRWKREGPGRYLLLGEYIRDSDDVCAVVEGAGRSWSWKVYAVWTDRIDNIDEEGDGCDSKRRAQWEARAHIIDVLGAPMTRQEYIEHNNNAKRDPGQYGVPLPIPAGVK